MHPPYVLRLDGVAQDDDGERPQDGDGQLLGLAEALQCRAILRSTSTRSTKAPTR